MCSLTSTGRIIKQFRICQKIEEYVKSVAVYNKVTRKMRKTAEVTNLDILGIAIKNLLVKVYIGPYWTTDKMIFKNFGCLHTSVNNSPEDDQER
jgi:hypothetical protein